LELHGKNLVGGERAGGKGDAFKVRSRLTGENLTPSFVHATNEQVDRAAELAGAAFEEYRTTPARVRAAFLEDIAARLEEIATGLITRAEQETALSPARLRSELSRTTGHLRMFAALIREGSWVEAKIDRVAPDRQPTPRPDLRKMLVPLGPVAMFGASNFPFAYSVAGGDTASALAAGCPVVVKAHPSHPGVSEIVGEVIVAAARDANLPAGVFSMVHGGVAVGQRLVKHPAIQAVGFTGSLRGGRALFDAAAARLQPIPVYAEMGSTNPVFILPGALRERSATISEGLINSMSLGVGQFCTSPGLGFLFGGSEANQFRAQLQEHAAKVQPGTMLNDNISTLFHEGAQRLGSVPGVKVLSTPQPTPTAATPLLTQTDASTFLATPKLHEELFGPATLLITCNTPEEMEAAARALHGQLTATVHGTDEDLRTHARLLEILRHKAGRLIVNGYPTGVEVTTAMHHGGPYPATTDSRTTSVGPDAIRRFARPVCFQNFPQTLLPPELQDENPLGIWRMVDGEATRKGV